MARPECGQIILRQGGPENSQKHISTIRPRPRPNPRPQLRLQEMALKSLDGTRNALAGAGRNIRSVVVNENQIILEEIWRV